MGFLRDVQSSYNTLKAPWFSGGLAGFSAKAATMYKPTMATRIAAIPQGLHRGWAMTGFASGLGERAFLLGTIGYNLAHSERGQAVSKTAGATIGWGAGTLIGGAIGSFLLPGIGATVGSIVGGFIAQSPIEKGIQKFVEFDRTMRGLRMGGGYTDSNAAFTMRMRANQEMSGSLLNARMYLGSEGAYFHG